MRTYRLKRRADRMEQTRRRIIQAALEMHDTVGPAATTISAIAERAGVERLTVYRHFPDADSLFEACIERYASANPAPDPGPWRRIGDPAARLRIGLTELYGYYGRTESMSANSLRDAPALAPTVPVVARWLDDFGGYLTVIRDILATGWGSRGRRRALLLAAVGHAISFHTWRSLVRDQGLDGEGAADVMVGFVRCVAAGGNALGSTTASPDGRPGTPRPRRPWSGRTPRSGSGVVGEGRPAPGG